MKVVFQGAESKILLNEHNQIVKTRFSKKYKHPTIDQRHRARRTKGEAKILQILNERGISAPIMISYNDDTIVMEFLDFPQLTSILNENKNEESKNALISLAQVISQLHDLQIVHNDLTPSNVLFDGQKAIIIDFGLAQRGKTSVEDLAVDLYVLERSLNAMGKGEFFEYFISAYQNDLVKKRLKEVEKRGRKRELE
ncbi:TP53 regulating kinase [Spironucleus salmonicida]|uniref:non-specific serine/threonine protein kinase n=1 Tax=Spironucleus salmonicida TaxID=348837 RepID=V6LHN4_9EUKA|nr:TP53 regulating kinase [Spironucleus salmonicida]|eukprot:EST43813.1 TP53 regulating kinase [Spironucleus salmonicida]